jgi:hypothetical protein
LLALVASFFCGDMVVGWVVLDVASVLVVPWCVLRCGSFSNLTAANRAQTNNATPFKVVFTTVDYGQ